VGDIDFKVNSATEHSNKFQNLVLEGKISSGLGNTWMSIIQFN
jgi:hypothetical protein